MTELDQQQEGAEMQSNDSSETDVSTGEAPAGDIAAMSWPPLPPCMANVLN